MDKIKRTELAGLLPDESMVKRHDPIHQKYISWQALDKADKAMLKLVGVLDHEGRAVSGAHYKSDDSGAAEPIALAYYPYYGCEIYQYGNNGGFYFVYMETGGHAWLTMCRWIRASLIMLDGPDTPPRVLEIKKGREIQKATIVTWPVKDPETTHPNTIDLTIPGMFENGMRYQVKYTCVKCKQTVQKGGDIPYIATRELTTVFMQGELLDILGTLFQLEKQDNRGNDGELLAQYYCIDPKHLKVPSFGYYKCGHCGTQYLLCFRELWDDERYARATEVDVHAIYEVMFDEAIFMEKFKASKVSPY